MEAEDNLDKEIKYYESMLGLDTEDPERKRLLELELKNENMYDLFSCVNNILGEKFENLDSTQKKPESQLVKRKKEKKWEIEEELDTKHKMKKFKKILSGVKKDKILKNVKELENLISDQKMKINEICYGFFSSGILTDKFSKYKYCSILDYIAKCKNHSSTDLLAGLFQTIFNFMEKIEEKIPEKKLEFLLGILSFTHFFYTGDVFEGAFIRDFIEDIFKKCLTPELITKELTKSFIFKILKSFRLKDASYFLNVVEILGKFFEENLIKNIGDKAKAKELNEIRIYYEDKVDKLRSNLEIGKTEEEANSFVLNFLKRSLKNSDIYLLDTDYEQARDKILENKLKNAFKTKSKLEKISELQTNQNEKFTSKINSKEKKLLKSLTKKLDLGTSLQSKILLLLIRGDELSTTLQQILSLKIKRQEKKQVAEVIYKACQNEKKYNNFYGGMASKLCHLQKEYQTAFYYVIWDEFSEIENLNSKKILKFAKFINSLLKSKAADSRLFKFLNRDSIDKKTLQVTKNMLKNILSDYERNEVKQMAFKIAAKEGWESVSRNLGDVCFLVESKKEKYSQGFLDGDKERFFDNLRSFRKFVKRKGGGGNEGFDGGDDEYIEF